jgi:hypothetical protein
MVIEVKYEQRNLSKYTKYATSARHYILERLNVRNYNYYYDSRNYTIVILKG